MRVSALKIFLCVGIRGSKSLHLSLEGSLQLEVDVVRISLRHNLFGFWF